MDSSVMSYEQFCDKYGFDKKDPASQRQYDGYVEARKGSHTILDKDSDTGGVKPLFD